ncbi:hypothetical protein TNCV_2241071 [Trichonephila clavipes]|nr:hypothetical protein TNCV_2241071 [Trichonephila clavipes]
MSDNDVILFSYTRAFRDVPRNFESSTSDEVDPSSIYHITPQRGPKSSKKNLTYIAPLYGVSLNSTGLEYITCQQRSNTLTTKETMRSVSEINVLQESVKQAYVLAEDRLKLLIVPISQHDGLTQVRETNDLIEKLEATASELCDMTNKFENAVTGIEEKVFAVTQSNGGH